MTTESVTPAPAAKQPADWAHFAREHSGLILTGSYILLIFVGLMYEVWLFLHFRVNILYYAEAADFLLVPFREPLVSVVAFAPIPLWIWYMRFGTWVEGKLPKAKERRERAEARVGGKENYQRIRRIVSVLAIFLWSIAFTGHYANRVAKNIRAGKYRVTRIELLNGAPVEGQIIGTTGQFVFVYDRPSFRARGVPVENISQMVFPERKKKK